MLGCEVVGVSLRLPAPPRQQPAGPPQLLHEAPLPPPLLARPRRRAPAGRPQPRGRGAADHGVHAGRCPGSCHHLVLTPHSLTFTSCNNVNLNISIPSEVEVSVSSLLKHKVPLLSVLQHCFILVAKCEMVLLRHALLMVG